MGIILHAAVCSITPLVKSCFQLRCTEFDSLPPALPEDQWSCTSVWISNPPGFEIATDCKHHWQCSPGRRDKETSPSCFSLSGGNAYGGHPTRTTTISHCLRERIYWSAPDVTHQQFSKTVQRCLSTHGFTPVNIIELQKRNIRQQKYRPPVVFLHPRTRKLTSTTFGARP